MDAKIVNKGSLAPVVRKGVAVKRESPETAKVASGSCCGPGNETLKGGVGALRKQLGR